MTGGGFDLIPVGDLPEIGPGEDLGGLIPARVDLRDGDIVVVSQKAVSKAEGRTARLAAVEPGEEALRLAAELDKDPALVELILRETARIVRSDRVLIVETHSGLVCANAGIDSSNSGDADVVLLPADPDRSARRLKADLLRVSGAAVGVLISDSFGRPWRVGQAEVAIGCAGFEPLDDWRGRYDRDGRELKATEIAFADQLAGAADLVRDKLSGTPVVVARGFGDRVSGADGPGAVILRRPAGEDLFR